MSLLVECGVEARDDEDDEFLATASPAAKRAFKGRFALREPLEIDEDRRKAKRG